MEFHLSSGAPERQRSDCLILGVYAKRELGATGKRVDALCDGYLERLLKRGEIEGRIGQTLLLHDVAGLAAARLLLVGCGAEDELNDNKFREISAKAIGVAGDTGASESLTTLTELPVGDRDSYWKVRQTVEAAAGVTYRFERLKTRKEPHKPGLKSLRFSLSGGEHGLGARAVRDGRAIAGALRLAKDLANLPGNHCTPSYLADQARELHKAHPAIKVRVLDEAQMKRLGMGALLAVARGSREPPRLIVLEYRGARKTAAPICLVGKGVTFDSGGISIKPAAAMDEMKYDMSGAASVLGALQAAAELKLPLHLVGLIPTTENMPGGNAVKPGDVVRSLSGQTIEVLNTDAEGRLILCDALSYAARYKPGTVIDVATLTGACVIALGQHASGLMSNDEALAAGLLQAGQTSGDRAWQLPLWEEYQKQLDSPFADMANVGGREAGSVTAACFLSRFTKGYKWAHLDIAGTAWRSTNKKGATGRPVPLLVQYLLDRTAHDAG